MATNEDRTSERSDASQAARGKELPWALAWLVERLRPRHPRVAQVIVAVFLAGVGAWGIYEFGDKVWKGVDAARQVGIALHTSIEPTRPGRITLTINNLTDRSLVASGVAVRVLSVERAPLQVSGDMAIPLAASYDVELTPFVGESKSVRSSPFTIAPRGAENIDVFIGVGVDATAPWFDCQLEFTVLTPESGAAAKITSRTILLTPRR